MYLLRYQDDGPSGLCGQSMEITCKYDKLIKTNNPNKVKDDVSKITGRKNARLTGCWDLSNNYEYKELIY